MKTLILFFAMLSISAFGQGARHGGAGSTNIFDGAVVFNGAVYGAGGFTGNGAALTLDASGFNGNLDSTKDTFQEVAQALDDLTASGSPGGSSTHIQYNNSSSFAGEAALAWNATSDVLTTSNAIFNGNVDVYGTLTGSGVVNFGALNVSGNATAGGIYPLGITNAVIVSDAAGKLDDMVVGSGLSYDTGTRTLSATGGGVGLADFNAWTGSNSFTGPFILAGMQTNYSGWSMWNSAGTHYMTNNATGFGIDAGASSGNLLHVAGKIFATGDMESSGSFRSSTYRGQTSSAPLVFGNTTGTIGLGASAASSAVTIYGLLFAVHSPSVTLTNGVIHPQITNIPTNYITTVTGATNIWTGNIGGTPITLKTNAAAGGWLRRRTTDETWVVYP